MNRLPEVKIKPHFHREKKVVQVLFERNEALTQLLRSHSQMRWSQTMACWYLPYSEEIVGNLFHLLKGKAFLNYEAFKPQPELREDLPAQKNEVVRVANTNNIILLEGHEQKIHEFKLWMRSRRYSENTITTYTEALRLFLRYFAHKPRQCRIINGMGKVL